MRSVYKVLAALIAIEVAIQAAVMVYAIAGLGLYIEGGGVLDAAAVESGETLFPELIGLILHGLNGMFVIPALALVLLIVSFFAKVPGGVRMAAVVLGLVVLQVLLGMFLHGMSWLGLLHGLNALALFGTAVVAARRVPRADVPVEQRTRQSALT
ncbi:hypothetical protein [Cellulomonas aerilata]|uniref:Uncharacterized protein n=1 Tax=Cellulomonas aerilata TaxID=515326 RepID=A0A512DCW7_9CELL|nr:hypothetical protein [Cellulomonas aerilata]GEO34277.1 hypothetical protein CAE01nite_20020 [Cellulomonas aerilata]